MSWFARHLRSATVTLALTANGIAAGLPVLHAMAGRFERVNSFDSCVEETVLNFIVQNAQRSRSRAADA